MTIIGFALAFISIIYMSVRKVSLAVVMLVASIIVGITSDMPVLTRFETTWAAISDISTIELVLAVISIGVFSTVMKELGFLDKTIRGLTSFLGNLKAAIMIVPALIGALPVLGGAAVSAPFVDKLGTPLDLSNDVKAAINLIFRHGMLFVFPFSPSLILTASLAGVPVSAMIFKVLIYAVVLWVLGFVLFLSRAKSPVTATESHTEHAATRTDAFTGMERFEGFKLFLKYGGPLIAALALGLIAGLPLWLSLLAGTGLAVIIGLSEHLPLPTLKTMAKGSNFNTAMAMFGIMVFRAFVSASPVFATLVEKAGDYGIPPVLMAMIFPLLFGYGSASNTTTVGVLIPILVPQGVTQAVQLSYVSIIYCASFVAYFVSPLHLCQILTCQYFKIDIAAIYKKMWPVVVTMLSAAGIQALMLTRIH